MIYLSICIPTYNRSSYLFDTLESIVSQPEFNDSDEIEIVISDNCSTDDTEIVVNKFLNRYPNKIKYNKNAVNILDRNYEKVLSMASGAMLKLNNDTLLLNQGCLSNLLSLAKDCLKNNLIPFLLNGEINYSESIICSDEISFISTVSYRCTWIGGFMISKEQFDCIDDFSSKASLMLTQVYVLFELLKKGNQIMVVPDIFSTSLLPAKKGGYNLPRIFLTNYFKILNPYFLTKRGMKAFRNEKKNMLYKFVLPWLANLYREDLSNTENFSFDKSGYQQIIKNEFAYFTFLVFQISLTKRVVFYFFKTKMKGIVTMLK